MQQGCQKVRWREKAFCEARFTFKNASESYDVLAAERVLLTSVTEPRYCFAAQEMQEVRPLEKEGTRTFSA